MSADTKHVYNLEQAYWLIGEHYHEIWGALQPALLDPSASEDEATVFRLGLVTVFQYAENLDDWMAAQATTKRPDWRSALHLPHKHPGFSVQHISKFRASVCGSAQALHEFGHLLKALGKVGLFSLQEGSLNAEKVVFRVCNLNHFVQLKRAMKAALSALVAADPHWLSANALPHWYERYKPERLDSPIALSDAEIRKEAMGLGRDIQYLLAGLQEQDKTELFVQPEVQALTRLFQHDFVPAGDQLSWHPRCSPQAVASNPGAMVQPACRILRPFGEMVITGILTAPKQAARPRTKVILLWGYNEALAAEVASSLPCKKGWKVVQITGQGSADSLSQAARRLNPAIVILLNPGTDTRNEVALLLKEQPTLRVISMTPENLTVDVVNPQNVWLSQLADLIAMVDNRIEGGNMA